MENYYEIFSNKKIGEKMFISTSEENLYEFTKIAEYKYLVEFSIKLMNRELTHLTGTMTTMEASLLYETLKRNN